MNAKHFSQSMSSLKKKKKFKKLKKKKSKPLTIVKQYEV